MKIMFVVNKDLTLYLFRKELIEKIIANNNQVVIICPYGPKLNFFNALGCIILNIPIDRRGKNIFKELVTLIKIKLYIKKASPDIVFSYTIKPNLYVGIASRNKKFKFVPTITGLGSSMYSSQSMLSVFLKLLYKYSFKNAHQIFVQNSEIHDWLKNYICPKANIMDVNGSGVNLEFYKYCEIKYDTPTIFLFLGRIMKEKGIDEFIQASIYLKEKYQDDIQIRVAGFFEEDYQKVFESLNQVIKYIGYIDDTRTELSNCSALVLPSYHEGLSNVLLEAQATGRPVIASNIPGCVEAFIDGTTGYSVEKKNAFDLQNKMELFHKLSFSKKLQMGRKARLNIELNFDREKVIEKYMKIIYEEGKYEII